MNAISKSLAAAFTALCSPLLYAQAYPAKHIKFMVGFAAGGAADVTARMLAPKLSELLGQQVIIENRGGSGGMLATDAVAKSAPDGYTLLLMPAADTVHVPYKGISDGVTAVASGEVDMIFASIPASLPLLTAKRVRAFAMFIRDEIAQNIKLVKAAGIKVE